MARLTVVLRVMASAAVMVAGGVLALHGVATPWKLNVLSKTLQQQTRMVNAMPNEFVAKQLAATHVRELSSELEKYPFNIHARFLLAANLQLSGDVGGAIDEYHRILRMEERPEVYMALAEAEVSAGEREKAMDHMARACRFAPVYLDEIRDPELKEGVVERLRSTSR